MGAWDCISSGIGSGVLFTWKPVDAWVGCIEHEVDAFVSDRQELIAGLQPAASSSSCPSNLD